ncbi:MAG: hypothetical protein QNJ36_16855 [Calothrix sp. MO_167.B42]|nr:hypothetical protein [Calothrix sp. MO_167.B42]
MVIENAEVQTQGTRRNKEAGQPWADGDGSGGTSQNLPQHGSESFAIGRDDWERRDNLGGSEQETPGGILDRLINKVVQQIDETEKRLVELRQELADLRKLSEKTNNQTKEE